jgi:hypothetical protein
VEGTEETSYLDHGFGRDRSRRRSSARGLFVDRLAPAALADRDGSGDRAADLGHRVVFEWIDAPHAPMLREPHATEHAVYL